MKSDPTAIRARRERAGHTRPTLGKASGVSQQRIAELETDACPLLPTTARKLAEALGCDIPDIVTDLLEVTAR